MDLNKQTIRYYEMVICGNVDKEESADIIVPDMYPDIQRLVDTSGLAVVKEKRTGDGTADISGVVKVSVLYRPEGEAGLRRIELSLPYSHTLEHPAITDDTVMVTRVSLQTADARMVNPRKVNVTVILNLDMKAYGQADWEICQDLSDAAEHGVELKRAMQTAYMPVAVNSRGFTATDELEVPASKPAIVDLLRADVKLSGADAKPIGNKLVVKGLAAIRLLYTTAGETGEQRGLATADLEMPFSHIMEMPGLDDGCVADAVLTLGGVDIDLRTGLGGESRSMGVTLQIEAQAVASADRHITSLTDLYSTAYEVQPQFQTVELSRLLEKNLRHFTARDNFEAGQPIQSVLDTRVALWPVEIGDSGLACDAQVTVLFMAEDGEPYTAVRRVRIELPAELPEGARMSAVGLLGGEVTAAATHDGLDVRFGVDFDTTVTQIEQFVMVSGVNADLTSPKEDRDHPSVVLRRSRLGESLWNIAKAHNTTMEQIAGANHLELEEELPEGKMLLIPYMR